METACFVSAKLVLKLDLNPKGLENSFLTGLGILFPFPVSVTSAYWRLRSQVHWRRWTVRSKEAGFSTTLGGWEQVSPSTGS